VGAHTLQVHTVDYALKPLLRLRQSSIAYDAEVVTSLLRWRSSAQLKPDLARSVDNTLVMFMNVISPEIALSAILQYLSPYWDPAPSSITFANKESLALALECVAICTKQLTDLSIQQYYNQLATLICKVVLYAR
jgi:hypothetical protein